MVHVHACVHSMKLDELDAVLRGEYGSRNLWTAHGKTSNIKTVKADHYDAFPWGYRCQWVPSPDMCGITWNGNDTFYKHTEWLQWLQDNILSRWGLQLQGELWYQGQRACQGAVYPCSMPVTVVSGCGDIGVSTANWAASLLHYA